MMALYTVVGEGYDVDVFRSFESLWKYVSQCHRRTDNDSPLWMDDDESVKLTKDKLREEITRNGYANISEEGYGGDWTIKIKKQ